MADAHDILQLKTEAELRFFIDNPSYYQPELVAAAQRELRRRGLGAAPALPAAQPLASVVGRAPAPTPGPAPGSAAYASADESAAPQPAQRTWLLLGSVGAVVFLAGLGFWAKSPGPQPAPVVRPAPAPAAAKALTLEEAPTSPLPSYNAEDYVERALGQVPAPEKHNEQLLSQYRAISRLFWAAQNPSAHLIGQAQAGQATPSLGGQAQFVLGLWHDFDRTQVYRYSFGPVMADHLARMKTVAQYQREALQELTNDTAAARPPHLDDDQTLAHQQALAGLLAPLGHPPASAARPHPRRVGQPLALLSLGY